jgi:hypothetical protein
MAIKITGGDAMIASHNITALPLFAGRSSKMNWGISGSQ